ncbi:outer membrane beta-barrel protein [Sulfurimonas sp. SAG-AH-194-C21]|nr:porin family protein [Sulfurimonas sp. SAG-AH-194-C21]MDF1882430.1 outer membrane beta-barrel protein [Sulfurimonas sp. SAG-AH-194-C21]
MKKIILFTLLATSLFAQAKVYMGLGYNLYNESYSYSASALPDTSDNALRLKFGYGIRESYAVEFALNYIEHASYNETPEAGKAKYGFNIALMKAFDLGIYVNPFIKIGFGAGVIDTSGLSTQSLAYGSFDAGTGFFIPINDFSDFEIAYEYKNLSYEKQDELDSTIQNASHVNSLYFGYNIRF